MFKIFKREQPKPETKNRIPQKMNVGLKRNFNAGVADRLNASWSKAPISADQLVFSNLTTLRARSREQVLNNDYARRFLSMLKSNVVGQRGISIQSTVTGRKGDADTFAQNAIENHFKAWSHKKNCSLNGRQSWKTICNLALSTTAADGEVLVRLHPLGTYGLQLELIDAERLDVRYNGTLKNGNTIRFAIEFNGRGVAVAYHLTQPDDANGAGIYTSTTNSKKYMRVQADQIMHLFVEDQIDQKRGFPWMSTALQRMKMLQGYEDASLVAARAGASKMGFYKSIDGAESYGEQGADGEILEDFEAGTISQMPAGMEWQTHDPDYPAGEFSVFMKACLRGIASGLSVSYNTLANDLEGVNFSSMRHGAIEEREVWKALQEWLIESLVQPIYEEWITRAYQLEIITIQSANGIKKPLSRPLEEYLGAHYQPKRWDWVDPLKDIQAKEKEVLLGITSISSIIRDKGGDPAQIWREIETEREVLKSLGITLEVTNGINKEIKEPDTAPANVSDEAGD